MQPNNYTDFNGNVSDPNKQEWNCGHCKTILPPFKGHLIDCPKCGEQWKLEWAQIFRCWSIINVTGRKEK